MDESGILKGDYSVNDVIALNRRSERLQKAVEYLRTHIIMNDVNGDRVHEIIEEALYGYQCDGCKKLLMPENDVSVRNGEAACVYVHKETCEERHFL